MRRLVAAAPEPPAELAPAASHYADLVRRNAYLVSDGEVGALREAGMDADAIFELTVATALAAGIERLEAGLRALEEAR